MFYVCLSYVCLSVCTYVSLPVCLSVSLYEHSHLDLARFLNRYETS